MPRYAPCTRCKTDTMRTVIRKKQAICITCRKVHWIRGKMRERKTR